MTPDELQEYGCRGYHVARGVFSVGEVGEMLTHYMARRTEGPKPGDSAGMERKTATTAPDPWKQYPRMIQMHHWDEPTSGWMNDARLTGPVAAIMGQAPKLIQTMVYFKPPGGRGQSFHQDCYYLRTTPIVAAWVALDGADEENGSMQMIRGSHLLGLLPVGKADLDVSVTEIEAMMPPYLPRDLVALDPGDAVFFGGLTIHGSLPNRSATRFRRAFICHYAGEMSYPVGAPAALPGEAG